jgi:putative lipoic acid-binding regulatory protein
MAELEISPIQYPLDFPIKIMGRNEPGFTQKVVAIVRHHAPDFDPSTVETRPSRKSAYLSVTCVIRATSRQQLDALYAELSGDPNVVVVL